MLFLSFELLPGLHVKDLRVMTAPSWYIVYKHSLFFIRVAVRPARQRSSRHDSSKLVCALVLFLSCPVPHNLRT